MGKSTFNSFSQLAAANLSTEEPATEVVAEVTSASREGDSVIVDTTGEDLGDVTSDTVTGSTADEDTPVTVSLNDRDVATWTTEELEGYITGSIEGIDIYRSTVDKAIIEHRIRESTLDAAWTADECKTYLLTGAVPAKTSKGAWVKDVTRQYRREHQWSTQELESWALGEIKPEGATLASGLAIELKSRLNLVVPSVDVDAVITCYKHAAGLTQKATIAAVQPTAKTATVTEAQVTEVTAQIKYEGLSTMNQSYIESSLAKFGEVMRPGKAVNEVTGGEAQKLLKQVITYAISLPDPAASRAAMQVLFDHFRANRSSGKIFEDTYAYRFIDKMKVTKKEQEAHADLLTLFLAYADPMTELRAQTDVASLIKGVPSQLQPRVLEFFSKV